MSDNETPAGETPSDDREGHDGQTEYLYQVDKRVDEDGHTFLINAWGPDFEEARARYENAEETCKPLWERNAWSGDDTVIFWTRL